MKKLLGKSDGVLVARMPVPSVGPREVLVRVRYSLISTGTETASMTPGTAGPSGEKKPSTLYAMRPNALPATSQWPLETGSTIDETGGRRVIRSGEASYAYAVGSPVITLSGDSRHVITVRARLHEGNVSCGLLAADGSAWLAMQSFPYPMPELAFSLYIDVPPGGDIKARIVISNNRPGVTQPSRFEALDATHVSWVATRDALPEPPADGTDDDGARGLKGTVKQLIQKWAGEKDSRTEKWLREWYRYLSGKPGAAMPGLVPAEGLPVNEMSHQGWSLGYSCAGEVVAIGAGVKEFAVGDRVACAGEGASHGEFACVPVNLAAKLPDGVDFRAGASATVGAIAMQGVRRAELALGERVVVIGMGLIGQITGQLCKAAGCRVIGFDLAADRVQAAIGRAIDEGAATDDAVHALVRRLTDGHGADAVIITAATKSDAPINLAMKLARRRGRVVISGDVDIHPERRDFYRKEIDLRMATSYGPGRYDPAYEEEGRDYPLAYARWTSKRNMESYLELIAAGKVDFLSLVEAEFTIDDAPSAYEKLLGAGRKPLAVLLHYPEEATQAIDVRGSSSRSAELVGGIPVRDGPINFVLVGAGAFGQSMLVPKMLAHADLFQFYGVVSRHGTQGSNFARSLGVSRIASELTPFLEDPKVHMLVIATRHHEHTGQALAGLAAGKHVFVEKPLGITWEQLHGFVEGYEKIAKPPSLLVGFNRRFSPAVARLRAALAGRRGPLMMNYRMNAGYVPLDSWLQGEHGGGRNIGEACHMYDVFRGLAGAPVEHVHAQPLGHRPADRLANDNFIVTLRYADGSVATLTYTALGPREGLPKERLEVFCDGQAYVMDDYVRLIKAGDGAPLWEGAVDKGHAEELLQFGRAIADGKPSPISVEEILETTALALKIEESLR
ncbi:MAG: bi-domain-containing oxidoreductase [Planctomycetes bacterium]|nr:bi-domain-containing oxidoreductase [Planctomycetota bacterium]